MGKNRKLTHPAMVLYTFRQPGRDLEYVTNFLMVHFCVIFNYNLGQAPKPSLELGPTFQFIIHVDK